MCLLRSLFSRLAYRSLLGLTLLAFFMTSCSGSGSANGDLEQQVLEIIRKNPEVILESVSKYQQEQQAKQAEARQKIINQIATQPQVIMANSPTMGNGQTLLVEFSDFECPFCARAHENVKAFVNANSDKVKLVYKHLPLTQIHAEATPAAQAAWAAQQQGKFWEFHDALFENQDKLGDGFYQETAKSLKLDVNKFDQDRKSKTAKQAIEADLKLARALDLNGTPSFIMNGQLFSGAVSVDELEQRLAQK